MHVAEKQFSHTVFIGRFQPFHLAHQEVIDIALTISDRVILILGSAQDQRSIKNPFSVAERQQMILMSFSSEDAARIQFVPMIDHNDDQKWVAAVKAGVQQLLANDLAKIALIGHFKDESSYYLRLFQDWQLVELPNLKNALSATPLRAQYFTGQINRQAFSTQVQAFLTEFQHSSMYAQLCQRFAAQDFSVL